MDSKINMGTLSVSGVSLAMGLLHANSLSSLTKDVEDIKKSMVPDTEPEKKVSLFGDTEEATANHKPIDPEATHVQQIETVVSGLETSVASLSKLPNAIKNLRTNVETSEKKVASLDTRISTTTESIQPLIDVSSGVQRMILEYKSLSKKTGVTDDGQFLAEDCNIGLVGNSGDRSALHFMGLSNNKWAMYMADPSGKGPSKPSDDGTPSLGEVPPTHAGVTGRALRVRVGGTEGDGVLVENSIGKGLFSVGNDGRMTAGATVVGDIDSNTAGIAYMGKLTSSRFAVSQHSSGVTRANAIAGRDLQLCVAGTPQVWLDELGAMGIKNQTGTPSTFFNSKGSNIIVAKSGHSTRFRTGTSTTDHMVINDSGMRANRNLHINGKNLHNILTSIESRLTTLDGQQSSSTSSGTIIATPEPFDHPPATIKNNTKIALKNVQTGKYIWVNNSSGNFRVDASHTGHTGSHFTIQTQDNTANVSGNNRVRLKSVAYGKYLTHVSGDELKATGTSKFRTAAHFNITNIHKTSPIKEDDTIVLLSVGGGSYVTVEHKITAKSFKISLTPTGKIVTNGSSSGDGRLDPKSQFIIERV